MLTFKKCVRPLPGLFRKDKSEFMTATFCAVNLKLLRSLLPDIFSINPEVYGLRNSTSHQGQWKPSFTNGTGSKSYCILFVWIIAEVIQMTSSGSFC